MESGQIICLALVAAVAWSLEKLAVFLLEIYLLKKIKDEVLDVDGSVRNDRRALVDRWLQKETLLRYELMRHIDEGRMYDPVRVEEAKRLLNDPDANILAYIDRRRRYSRRFPFVKMTDTITVVIEKPFVDEFQLETVPWELGQRISMLCCARSYLGIHPSELRPRVW